MRTSREAAARTRAHIIEEAARLFRERGFDAVGVDTIMKAAGLTHGGFYSHFRGKDDLVAEAVAAGLAANRAHEARHATLDNHVAAYLSPAHRDGPGSGCCLAALGSEMARGDTRLRGSVTAHLQAEIDRLTALSPGPHARQRAIAVLAGLVGALTLARAADDPALSNEILSAARDALRGGGEAPSKA